MVSTTREPTESSYERIAALFLTLLIAGDLAFIGLHLVNDKIELRRLLNLEMDRGYPEFYQYMKLFWICILLIYVSFRRASKHYIAWVFLFAYLLLDDALQIHERGGKLIAANLDFEPLLGLRLRDYGELAVTIIAGVILLVPLFWAYRSGTQIFRKISQDIALLMTVLLFFGVVVDMLHIAIKLGENVNFFLGLIEDGGEMLSVSLILWYFYLIAISTSENCTYLCESIWFVLTKRSSGRAVARR